MPIETPTSPMNEKRQADSQIETTSSDLKSEIADFGGNSSLPPPPKLSPEEEKRLWRRIDLRLMPILAVMYLMSFLDRGMHNLIIVESLLMLFSREYRYEHM